MSDSVKTKVNPLRFEEVWHPKRGGRPGNRNAFKTGFHTGENRALRRHIALVCARAKALAKSIDPSPPPRGEVDTSSEARVSGGGQ